MTQTTLPFGHMDSQDVDDALEQYNQPLWKCLDFNQDWTDATDTEVLARPTNHWVDQRIEKGDIRLVDPSMECAYMKVVDLRVQVKRSECELQGKRDVKENEAMKISVAAAAMLKRQVQKLKGMGKGSSGEETDLHKATMRNIREWQKNKEEVLDKAFEILLAEHGVLLRSLGCAVDELMAAAHMMYLENQGQTDPTVDPDLLRELETIVDAPPTPKALNS